MQNINYEYINIFNFFLNNNEYQNYFNFNIYDTYVNIINEDYLKSSGSKKTKNSNFFLNSFDSSKNNILSVISDYKFEYSKFYYECFLTQKDNYESLDYINYYLNYDLLNLFEFLNNNNLNYFREPISEFQIY